MTIPVNHSDWQVLRAVLRGITNGRELRLAWSRRDKDGAHLTDLVRRGLLAVARYAPKPLDAAYTLTEAGRHAAEYGEYECDRQHVAVAR
jgi:hypothetical protein